ncbi:hypothetical protein COCC4DRAFT_65399 [Bipolaris maydis ATCC 48331]|uniref:Uncharacterized protein n=2 Tax=Cochliobolus heterostrophus TaxID=5016 RepID=M2UP00_COCH5|nr:uncharacterized protein COCC4DRAFT_65399 [Bipolaris maydis ATCC 48331]EMD95301.1 hypothetical protein COCHEDRAFT_1153113 [Bipolaris maydis C5]KAJ5021914.1 hypothetical protein J3E73DRAFT_394416 [Bipolaris maydis]ENI00449.1 hypothetical protein COCC4DRAFT_65399 [Bipolaris maydis ATCC 48331]KAJ6214304.1 hypothetical protein PSV09DRAFT_1153113 [Bipolaris maydis]KAJ6275496.1 hypothetical protein PSV08DRAFT_345883 [Bipolaris maydis]
MTSRLSHPSRRKKTPTSVLKSPIDMHFKSEFAGNSTTPPKSPMLSEMSNMEPLPSPWIKPCSQRAEVSTESEVSPVPFVPTSEAFHNLDPITVLLQQPSHTPQMKENSMRVSDLTALPFPSSRTLPAPTGFTKYMKTMKSESQQLGPTRLPPARQVFRKRREFLLVQALKDSIVNFSRTNMALRASIADEVKKGVEGNLTGIEKDPVQTVLAVGSHGRNYWSKVHQECHHGRGDWKIQPLHQIYSKKDIERILFFWAIHQSTLSYGEIACRLHLPVGALLSWILGCIDRVQEV